MQDKSINGALLALRKQIIREGSDGLEHVEALLTMRGIPMPRVMPAKRQDAARRGHMRVWLLGALRDGPKRLSELVEVVQAHSPDTPQNRVSKRVSNVLWKMRCEGLAVKDGGVWKLAP